MSSLPLMDTRTPTEEATQSNLCCTFNWLLDVKNIKAIHSDRQLQRS